MTRPAPHSLLLAPAAVLLVMMGGTASALDDGLARTPPMGWNSWNTFRLDINENLVRQVADVIVEKGLKDAGYEYLVIDDGWQIDRDEEGNIVVDPEKFPSGIKALADYVHSRGLKFGIYSDAGATDLRRVSREPGPRIPGRPDLRGLGRGLPEVRLVQHREPERSRQLRPHARRPARGGASDRLQHLRVGHFEALALGPGRGAPLAHHLRHPALLGLREAGPLQGRADRELHRLHQDPRPAGGAGALCRTGALERPRHAGGGQRGADLRGEQGPLQPLEPAGRAAHAGQRHARHDARGPRRS